MVVKWVRDSRDEEGVDEWEIGNGNKSMKGKLGMGISQ